MPILPHYTSFAHINITWIANEPVNEHVKYAINSGNGKTANNLGIIDSPHCHLKSDRTL